MKKINLMLLLLVTVLSACNSEETRKNEVFERVSKDVDRGSNGLMKFTEFEKIDGREIQGSGANRYELEFKGFLHINEDVCWNDEHVIKLISKSDVERGFTETSFPLEFKILPCGDSTSTNFQKKDTGVNVEGTAYFEKKDSGWKLLDYMLSDQSVKLKY